MRFRWTRSNPGIFMTILMALLFIALVVLMSCIPAGLLFLLYQFFLVPTFALPVVPFWVFLVVCLLFILLTGNIHVKTT